MLYHKKSPKPPINISVGQPGFGDACMTAMFVSILRDNNINAYLCKNKHSHLFDVPITQNISHFSFWHINWHHNITMSMMQQNLSRLKFKNIKITKNFVPVKFYDEKIDPVDVVLGTKCSGWSAIRNWKQFKFFKKILDNYKITWIDLDEKNIYGNLSLNYVKHAKAYIGLDTGRSHYSSFFANKKGIIIQSGHTNSNYWSNYDYKYIEKKCCSLAPCFLRFKHDCPHWMCCMNIKPYEVIDELKKILNLNCKKHL